MAKGSEPNALGVLLHYLVLVGDVQLGDLLKVFSISVAERKIWLQTANRPLAECYKQGRGQRFRANDRTWEWVASHFGEGLDRGPVKIRLQVLESLAKLLRRASDKSVLHLSELISAGDQALGAANPAPESVNEAIQRAYLEITGGRYSERALLKDLRARIPGYSKEQVDAALKGLWESGRVNLIEADLPGERAAEHALRDGVMQLHLMYMREAV